MSALAVLAIALGAFAVGEGAALGLQVRAHRRDQADAAVALSAEQEARRVEVAALTGDLAECRARVVPESLAAALGPELGEVQARAALVQALPRAEVTRALIAVASPQLLAAEVARLGCEAVSATGDSVRGGCAPNGPVLTAWARAVEALDACPEPGEGQAPE